MVSITLETDQNPTEFLNSLGFHGVHSYWFQLKIQTSLILLRNLCLLKRTRIATKQPFIKATILIGINKKDFPENPVIPTDLPFELKHFQFPVTLTFAMTINMSQIQSFKIFPQFDFPHMLVVFGLDSQLFHTST